MYWVIKNTASGLYANVDDPDMPEYVYTLENATHFEDREIADWYRYDWEEIECIG